MKIVKIDKRYKLYHQNYRYCISVTKEEEYRLFFPVWVGFCETNWGYASTVSNKRWQYTVTWNRKTHMLESKIFLLNDKDLMWFTLGTSS
jgi:hypothetical protein